MASPQRTKDSRHGVEHLDRLCVGSLYGQHTHTHTQWGPTTLLTLMNPPILVEVYPRVTAYSATATARCLQMLRAITGWRVGCRSRVREQVEHDGREVGRDNRSEPQLARDFYLAFLEVPKRGGRGHPASVR